MYFIRREAANFNDALGSHQKKRYTMQHPGYLNIRFLRELPNNISLPRRPVVQRIEPCCFNLVYDKDNACNWYLRIEASSFNSAIYYFSISDAIESALEIKDLASTLLHDMRPHKSLFTDNSLMRFLIRAVFTAKGKIHVSCLDEIEMGAHKSLVPFKGIAKKNILVVLFDYLLMEINQSHRTNSNKHTILSLLQIIHAVRKKPQFLIRNILESEDINTLIQLNKIKEKLNLPDISTELFPFIVTSEMHAIFQAFYSQRDHTIAATCCWMDFIFKGFDEQVANAYFCHQIWVALALAHVIGLVVTMSIFIITGASFSLLCGLMFAMGSLFFAQEARKPYMLSLRCMKDLDLEEVFHTFDNSFSLISEETERIITQLSDIFERCINDVTIRSCIINSSPVALSNVGFFASSAPNPASVVSSKQEENNGDYLSG